MEQLPISSRAPVLLVEVVVHLRGCFKAPKSLSQGKNNALGIGNVTSVGRATKVTQIINALLQTRIISMAQKSKRLEKIMMWLIGTGSQNYTAKIKLVDQLMYHVDS